MDDDELRSLLARDLELEAESEGLEGNLFGETSKAATAIATAIAAVTGHGTSYNGDEPLEVLFSDTNSREEESGDSGEDGGEGDGSNRRNQERPSKSILKRSPSTKEKAKERKQIRWADTDPESIIPLYTEHEVPYWNRKSPFLYSYNNIVSAMRESRIKSVKEKLAIGIIVCTVLLLCLGLVVALVARFG